MKPRKVFFHYNKPLSLQRGEMWMSVHFRQTCHMVRHVRCEVPIWSKQRKRQPRCVMEGYAHDVTVKNDEALIT